uniref:C-type lectin domain-containing protein n=1 Tax=Denticeps clupeoides TaxID=299321 RepID=A0AAY4CG84_9TELE
MTIFMTSCLMLSVVLSGMNAFTCPPGWHLHNSRCFFYVYSPMTWTNIHCINLGGSLASIQNYNENSFLGQLSSTNTWIGAFNFQVSHNGQMKILVCQGTADCKGSLKDNEE